VSDEWDKMVRGEPYDAGDSMLAAARARARALTRTLDELPPDREDARRESIERLLGRCGQRVRIEPPFRCDYGTNIELGDDVFVNFNCVVLDCAPVRVGARVLIGSGVQLLTATHPLEATRRRLGLESALPVVIGEDAWIGSGAIVCPGVTIGARAVIGAGSVVVADVPPDVLAVGNPCRVVRVLASDA
jgi:maltose O-acetyltransferase